MKIERHIWLETNSQVKKNSDPRNIKPCLSYVEIDKANISDLILKIEERFNNHYRESNKTRVCEICGLERDANLFRTVIDRNMVEYRYYTCIDCNDAINANKYLSEVLFKFEEENSFKSKYRRETITEKDDIHVYDEDENGNKLEKEIEVEIHSIITRVAYEIPCEFIKLKCLLKKAMRKIETFKNKQI